MSRVAIFGAPVGDVPQFGVILWWKPIADIPAGFALCDGTNGTPDMRDFFPKSVGAGEDPGATGGAATHTPVGTIDAHTTAADTATTGAGTRDTGPGTHTFTGTAANYEPPYKKWAFIMKL